MDTLKIILVLFLFLPYLAHCSFVESSINSTLRPDLSNNLIAYWKLDELTIGTVAGGLDILDSANTYFKHGTAVGGPQLGQEGHLNTAVKFDGINDTINVGNISNYESGFTTSFWFKSSGPNQSASSQVFLVQRLSSSVANYDFQVSIGFNETQLRCLFRKSNVNFSANYDLPTAVDQEDWHHFVCVFDSTTSEFTAFFDGIAGTPVNTGGVLPPSTGGNAFIGSNVGTSGFWNGSIDEVAIWSRPLTVSEIAQLNQYGFDRK